MPGSGVWELKRDVWDPSCHQLPLNLTPTSGGASFPKIKNKALRWGYNGNVKLLSELLHDADMKLFRSMLRSTHCIHQLLPPLKFIPMKLRTSHCAFVLPYCNYSLHKHLFVLRCIFDGAY